MQKTLTILFNDSHRNIDVSLGLFNQFGIDWAYSYDLKLDIILDD